MTDERALTEPKGAPRRRFLRTLSGLLGGLGTFALGWSIEPWITKPKDLPLREADFYRPHDLAG